MNKKMKIIPIFVPHNGCPNDCVFCNQKKITGKGTINVDKSYAINTIEEYLKTIDENTFTEIAFFGGSFTAINLKLQEELLKAAKYYKDSGAVKQIRISTRPDAINDDILKLQKKYGVNIIELGIQSLDDDVLYKSNRGHNRNDSENASKLIKQYGFILGHQIMPGLPGSSREKDIKTCKDSILMGPDIVRIYPTLIIKETELSDMYKSGLYEPLSLQEAVERSAIIYSLYMAENINVIRIGLQNTDTINENVDVEGGPFHPAFRQLVEEKIYLNSLIKKLEGFDLHNKDITIMAPPELINYISGHNKSNIKQIKSKFNINKISFKSFQIENEIEIYSDNKRICGFNRTDIFKHYISAAQGV